MKRIGKEILKRMLSTQQINTLTNIYNRLESCMGVVKQTTAGGTISARYCYSVFLQHLVMINKSGLRFPIETVAELGPGSSIGIGLAAMLSGVNKYYAFDVVPHANKERNCKVFDELIELFREREDIPDAHEFPEVKPYLESYDFPVHILTDEYLSKILQPDRLKSIRDQLKGQLLGGKNDIQIRYFAAWYDSTIIQKESVDMIYSQAVMEHVDDLEFTYKTLYKWLKPNGFMCHQIDFKSHDTSREWNGHWKYSDSEWKEIRGNQVYLLNREPYSTHVSYMKQNGFKIVCEKKIRNASEQKNAVGIQRNDLAPRFRSISDDDFTTSGVYVQAIKLV